VLGFPAGKGVLGFFPESGFAGGHRQGGKGAPVAFEPFMCLAELLFDLAPVFEIESGIDQGHFRDPHGVQVGDHTVDGADLRGADADHRAESRFGGVQSEPPEPADADGDRYGSQGGPHQFAENTHGSSFR
jgi:hypothetical protein